MISFLRDFTKSWIFQGVLVLLITSFAVYGLRDVFSSQGTNNVVTSGGRTVTDQDFKRIFDNYKSNYAQQNNGQSFTNDEFVQAGQHLAMLNELADTTALSAWLDKLGIKPSANLIVDQIAKTPYFFNSATGKFDKDAYRQALARQGLDEKTYNQELSDQIATSQYGDAALAGLKAPRILGAMQAAYDSQTRDASFFIIGPDSVDKPGTPTEADLQAFYKEHLPQMQIPELRQADIISFNPADVAKSIPADEAALQKMYQFEKDSLGTPEQRSFVEITAPDTASANAISAALKSGQSPDAAAKAGKGTVITYDAKPKTAVPDEKIANAAFAMKTGDVSGALQGDLGIAVVKMGDIKIGSTPTFDSVHAKLLADYQQQQAGAKINALTHEFQNAHDAGQDFKATADKMGLKIVPLPPMTAQGATGNPQVDYSKFTAIVKDIYDLQAGGTSDVEELGNGQYFALKLNTIKPAGAPPYEQVKPQLAQAWMAEKIGAAVKAASDKAMAAIKGGEAFDKVATDLHTTVQSFTGVDRGNTKKSQLNEEMIGRIFFAKPGDTFQATGDRVHVAIGKVDAVHQGDPAAANNAAAAVRVQISQVLSRDIEQSTSKAARAQLTTKTYPAVALRALGVTAPDAAAASSSKSK